MNRRMFGSTFAMMAFHWLAGICMTQTASAQQTVFQPPVMGGQVACIFDDLHCYEEGSYHTGIDYWGPNKTSVPILCSNVGVVDTIILNDGNDHAMGNCIIVRHAVVVNLSGATATYYTLYAHLASITPGLKVGQIVSPTTKLGMMGSTGKGKSDYYGKTPHLHFEVKTKGVSGNPSGNGQHWGYTPTPAENYGYTNPEHVIGSWKAIPLSR